MSTPKWTLGPWEVGYSDGSGVGVQNGWRTEGACVTAKNRSVVMGGDHDGCAVGVVAPSLVADKDWVAEMQANAKLIASAPELYEALAWCVRHLELIAARDYPTVAEEKLRRFNSTGAGIAALAKARGEVSV